MDSPLELIATQFRYTHFVIRANLAEVTQAESLRTPPSGGSSLNWVLGHIMATRNGILGLIGAAPVLTEEETAPYHRGSSAPGTADAPVDVARLLEALDASQQTILDGLVKLTPEERAVLVPNPATRREETTASVLAGLAFHEAYHAGQTGTLRRAIGKEGAIQ